MAGQTVGNLLVRIGADPNPLIKALDKVERSMMRFSGKMENIGRTLSTTITLPVIAMGAAALSAAAKYEQLETSFNILLGSAEKGAALFKYIKDFAAKTPFEVEEVSNAAKTMLSFGFSVDKVKENLAFLGDIAAATGGDLAGLTMVMGQSSATGLFMTKDLRQLAERGIPILKALENEYGINAAQAMDMAQKSQISYEMVEKALKKMTEKGGLYFGATAMQSQTLSGLFSTLKDSGVEAFAEIGMSISKTLKLDEVITKFTEKITALTTWFKGLSDEQRKVIIISMGVAAAIGPLLIGFATVTKVVTTAVIGFKGLLTGVMALTSPIGLVVIAIAAMAAGIVYAYNKNEEFREQINRVGAALSEAGQGIVEVWNKVKTLYGGIISSIWEATKPIFAALGNALKILAGIWLQVVAGFWESAGKIINRGLEMIDKVESKIAELQNSKVGQALGWIKEQAVSAGKSVAGAIIRPFQALDNLLGESEKKRGAYRGMVARTFEEECEEVENLGNELSLFDKLLGDLDKSLDQTNNKTKGLSKSLIGDKTKASDFDKVESFGNLQGVETDPLAVFNKMKAFSDKMADKMKSFKEQSVQYVTEAAQVFSQLFGNAAGAIVDVGMQAFQALDALVAQSFANREAALNSYYDKEKKRIEGSTMSEEHKQKAIASLEVETDKRRRKLARQQAIREKILAMVQGAVNVASAIIKALTAGPIAGPILAGVIGAMGAVQLGMIAGQAIPALAKGGLAYGPSMAMVGDNPGARVDPEVISPLSKLKEMMGNGVQRVIVEGRISGKDILLSSERAGNDRIRTRGY